MNEYLVEAKNNLNVSEETIDFLEQVGIVLTSEYGRDCHNYGIKGSPIDVEMIARDIHNIRDTEFLIEIGYNPFLICSKDTIYEWANAINQFTDLYPNY